jgi:hypothetical protein
LHATVMLRCTGMSVSTGAWIGACARPAHTRRLACRAASAGDGCRARGCRSVSTWQRRFPGWETPASVGPAAQHGRVHAGEAVFRPACRCKGDKNRFEPPLRHSMGGGCTTTEGRGRARFPAWEMPRRRGFHVWAWAPARAGRVGLAGYGIWSSRAGSPVSQPGKQVDGPSTTASEHHVP